MSIKLRIPTNTIKQNLFYSQNDSALEEARITTRVCIAMLLLYVLIFPLYLIINLFFGINIESILGFEINMLELAWAGSGALIGIVYFYNKIMKKRNDQKIRNLPPIKF